MNKISDIIIVIIYMPLIPAGLNFLNSVTFIRYFLISGNF
jgi:hypothetical protein